MRKREEIIMREICTAMKTEGGLCVTTTLTVYGRAEIDKTSLIRCCNRLAARGAEPVGVQLTLMIPFGYLGMQPLKERLLQGAEELGLEIMSFHEIETKAVTRPIATICIVGKCPRERLVYSSGMRPGDSILLTGFAGTEGAMRLAQEHGGKGLLADAERDYILEQGSRLSILRESLLVANHARAMLEVGEGGVLSALYRLCEASQCGAYLEEKDIPVLESTRALCRERVLDPLRLASLGSIVIATDHEEQVLDLMKGAGITCTCIGKAVSRAQGVRILCLDGMTRPCGKPRADELMKVYA